jgi:hypothetical protein
VGGTTSLTAEKGCCRAGKKRKEKNSILILGWTIDAMDTSRKKPPGIYKVKYV